MGKLVRLAWRNVWRNRRRNLIAVIAIALGLTFLIFFDGLFGGSSEAIFGNAVRLQGGNIQIHAPGYLEKAKRLPLMPLVDESTAIQAALAQPEVVSASSRINTSGMVSSREGTFPVTITGLEPEAEAALGLLAENIAAGRYLVPDDGDHVLIGQSLAERLDVGIGDRVSMVGRATHEQMRRRTMTVIGIYDMGLPEVEKGLVYISLPEAQSLFELRDQVTEVVVAMETVGQEAGLVERLRLALPDYEVNAWDEISPELRQSMDMNTQVMGIFGLIVLLIAAIGILNLLLMAVFERTREIGLLGAMGLKRREILSLFLLEGTMLGLMGALLGCLVGGLIVFIFGQVGLDWSAASEASDLTALIGERLYPAVTGDMLVARGATVVFIAALASLYPAWRASRREPAEALHFV